VGGVPGGEASGDFGHGGEVGTLKQAGGDGRAVASGAIDEDGTIFVQSGETFGEMVEWQVETAGDESFLAFTR